MDMCLMSEGSKRRKGALKNARSEERKNLRREV